MYKVIKFFTDTQDNAYPYNVGDEYPRKGITADKERINALLGGNNAQGQPLIKEVKTSAKAAKKATEE